MAAVQDDLARASEGADLDEMVAQLQAVTSGSVTPLAGDRVRAVIFRLLRLMTEQTKKVTRGQNTLSILLLLTDAVQVAGILTSPELGWSFDFLSWTSVLSVTRLLRIMVVGWAVAFTVWALSLAVMSLALANTGLVVWRVAIGVTGSVWPLRTLRAFVTVALTALYIPLLESASVFMSCDAMVQAYKEEAPECWGASHGALFAVSLVVVLLFVPFALVMQAVYFDDAPTSGNVEAKALARAELLDTMARTLLVYISLFASEQSRLGLTAITAVAYTVSTSRPRQRPRLAATAPGAAPRPV